jgi:hypothetical protein
LALVITENNMADIGALTGDQFNQQQISRQQKMAEMLLQQGLQQPQGQMVSGRYVAPSLTQNLAGLANIYMGQRGIEKAEKAQLDLADRLRKQTVQDLQAYGQAIRGTPEQTVYGAGMEGPTMEVTPAVAPDYEKGISALMGSQSPQSQALGNMLLADMMKTQKLGEGETLVRGNFGGGFTPVGQGADKFRAPLQIDTGTAIEIRDPKDPTKLIQSIPKAQGGQIYESSEGPLIINTKTNTATPLLGADGKPLSPKLSAEQSKDLTAINQQKAVISSALDLVQQNPSAFSFKRGAAVLLPFGETLAGRTETAPETESRAAVFNIVSKVINERAGAAQSAQEMKRLNAFLPSEFDNAQKIQDKLKGFNKYLEEQEKGVRAPTSKTYTPATSNVFASEADAQKAFSEGKLKAGQKITINGVTGTWQ